MAAIHLNASFKEQGANHSKGLHKTSNTSLCFTERIIHAGVCTPSFQALSLCTGPQRSSNAVPA